jgi:hypothetical protein
MQYASGRERGHTLSPLTLHVETYCFSKICDIWLIGLYQSLIKIWTKQTFDSCCKTTVRLECRKEKLQTTGVKWPSFTHSEKK